MSKTVLILGPTGRFGRNAATAFEAAGWRVRRFDRKTDTLDAMARGVDVIVNGWNPAYSKWKTQVMAMQPAIHRAALANDATVIIPGNVYVYGADTPSPWAGSDQHHAKNLLGRIRINMENSYREAGVRTIVLRAGDYLDTEASGNWFDKMMAPSLRKGALTYPGKAATIHTWAFLPDLARAAVGLAEQRDNLDRFEEVLFAGYALTAEQMANALSEARGHDVRLKHLTWWPFHLLRPLIPDMKHLFEMRYLWNIPHVLDQSRFNELLPDFQPTPAVEALRQAAAFVPVPKAHSIAATKATA